jgi:hypothetical protein
MRSGLDRDGVKWGFAERGSAASPFRFLRPATSARLFSLPIGSAILFVANLQGYFEECHEFGEQSAETRSRLLRFSKNAQKHYLFRTKPRCAR